MPRNRGGAGVDAGAVPADRGDAVAVGEPPGEPIAGAAVTVDAIVPSAESNKAQGRLAIARTGLQTTAPGAVVIIGSWLLALAKVDLDPGAGTDLPASVAGAFVTVGTIAGAYLMNRGRLRGEG